MNSATLESLTKSSPQNDFKRIFSESGNLEEMLLATYLRALEPDCFDSYRPGEMPVEPTGYRDFFERYLMLSEEKKSDGWRALETKFYGYFKALSEANAEAYSHKKFLREMFEFFSERNLLKQAAICRQRLKEFA